MKTVGILNMETLHVSVSGIDDYRPVSAASFLGRYRVLDFMISNLTNSGIIDINLFVKDRPRSTIEHINGTTYNFNSKRGRILILTGEKTYPSPIYNTDVAAFDCNRNYIDDSDAELVVIAPTHFVYKQDYSELIDYHLKSGNDLTMLCHSVNDADRFYTMCDVLKVDENGRVVHMQKNNGKFKHRVVSLESYVLSKKLFMSMVDRAVKNSSIYWFSDIIEDMLEEIKVGHYQHKGYMACLNSFQAFYEANLELRKADNLKEIINSDWPIYTQTHDTCPTIYKQGASVVCSVVGNGCEIAGKVIDSMIGRSVHIGEGAVVKNCVLMSGAVVGDNVHIENALIDRYGKVNISKKLGGTPEQPLYVKRGDSI